MLHARYYPYTLHFRQPATTSRDTLYHRLTYYLKIWDDATPNVYGIGECALFKGLGDDDRPDYEERLAALCRDIDSEPVAEYTSLRFGLETALRDLANGGRRLLWPGEWPSGECGIKINGLIWMGSAEEMRMRIDEKLNAGFDCLKLKIGGIDFDREVELLRYIRSHFSPGRLEIRLDANGSFTPSNAMSRLERLAAFHIHSIEQPVAPRQWADMARICRESPIPVALDEELIGVHDDRFRSELLDELRPAYIILKPSLCGGFGDADKWIAAAGQRGIGWWATSALESNVGLNAIAQWAASRHPSMPQGLGTGGLYVNNIPSPLYLQGDRLYYDPAKSWMTDLIF